MQQEMCSSYWDFKLPTQHGVIYYNLEHMACLQFVTQDRSPSLSDYNIFGLVYAS
jgi:hypothetical protein